MPESSPSDPNERAFAELVKLGMRELRDQRGPCPSPRELMAFHEHRLEPEEVERLQRHVEACGLCDVELSRLAKAKGDLGWLRVRPRLHVLLLYALIILLLYPAYLGIVPREGSAPPPSPPPASPLGETSPRITPIPIFSVDAVRSGPQNVPPIRVSADERSFVLTFLVPIKSSTLVRYDVTILRGDQTAVLPAQALGRCDHIGNCGLLCDSHLFPAGRYTLEVTETDSRGSKVTYPFPFEVHSGN